MAVPSGDTHVQVLLIWSNRPNHLKATLNPILSTLVAAGDIEEAHPDGASEGWEWRTWGG